MKNKTWLLCLIFLAQMISTFAQSSRNLTLLGQLPYPSPTLHGDVSDIWGYVDSTNREYAIVGLEKGVSIVDLSNPAIPTEVFYIAGASSIWRDIKTWNRHAYITNEKAGGMMIIDLRKLPGTIQPSDVYSYSGVTYSFSSAHNLFIDENGVAYIFGANHANGGAILLDLTTNPKVPVELGLYNDYYLHDGMVRGDTLWGAAINAGVFTVVDVSSKSTPLTLQTHATAHNFTHNCWVSDDGQFLYTTDEKPGAYIGSFDISDLSNIKNVAQIQTSPGNMVIPHNTHVRGDFLVTSYYKDGVTVVDATHPDNLVEIGWYDTSPSTSGSGFAGCWGAYPFLPSGNILASDIENGLFVLGANYHRGSYIRGKVLKFSDSSYLASATIECLNPSFSTTSNLLGSYKAAFADTGFFTFVVNHANYLPDTLVVHMQSGVEALVNFYLRDDEPFIVKGRVMNINNQGIDSALVQLKSSNETYLTFTSPDGFYTLDSVYEDFYELSSGKWHYITDCMSGVFNDSVTQNFTLSVGEYDDFTFDFGWHVESNLKDGAWDMEDFLDYRYQSSALFPVEEVPHDCGDRAYVTGPFDTVIHNVDSGYTRLISPIFDGTGLSNPIIRLDVWCIHSSDLISDEFNILLIQVNDTFLLKSYSNLPSNNQSVWFNESFRILDYTDGFSDLKLMIEVSDTGLDHWLKVGVDKFFLENGPVGIANADKVDWIIYPNPARDYIHYKTPANFNPTTFEIFNTNGKVVSAGILLSNVGKIDIKELSTGLYLLKIHNGKGLQEVRRLIKD